MEPGVVFRDAAVIKVQLFHIFEGLSRLVIWLEGFLEGFHKLLVCPPVEFIGFRFFAFFNLRLDELLFSDSSVSICQVRQDERNLLFIVVVYESVYFEVNITSCMNRTKSLRFPVKGFSGLNLTFSEAFVVVVAMVLGIVSPLLLVSVSVLSLGVEVSDVVKVS
jgi:hypothetical protein